MPARQRKSSSLPLENQSKAWLFCYVLLGVLLYQVLLACLLQDALDATVEHRMLSTIVSLPWVLLQTLRRANPPMNRVNGRVWDYSNGVMCAEHEPQVYLTDEERRHGKMSENTLAR
jgi:hypothetical protein